MAHSPAPEADLSLDALRRYQRQLILPEIRGRGQKKLLAARVLIVGAGGLGCPAAQYLAAAGIGHLSLIDADTVDRSNLQRQILFRDADQGRPKVEAARETLLKFNPGLSIAALRDRFQLGNAAELVRDHDFVIDACDNFSAKFLINDSCFFEKTAFSHAGAVAFGGQTLTVLPGRSTCYRCIFYEPPPPGAVSNCSEVGILGSVTGIIGAIQATECIKYLLGQSGLLSDRLLTFDSLAMTFRAIRIDRNPDCPLCGTHPRILELFEEDDTSCSVADPPKS